MMPTTYEQRAAAFGAFGRESPIIRSLLDLCEEQINLEAENTAKGGLTDTDANFQRGRLAMALEFREMIRSNIKESNDDEGPD